MPAGELECEVAIAVAVEVDLRRVRLCAVGLDHQLGVRPVEVDLVSADDSVHDGPRQAGRTDELKEAALELAAGGRSVLAQLGDEPAYRAGPTPAVRTGERRLERPQVAITVTSTRAALGLRSQSAAADLWLRTAPWPHARTAAMNEVLSLSCGEGSL